MRAVGASKTRVDVLEARQRPRRGAATIPRDNHRGRFPRTVTFRLQPAPRIQDLLARRGFAIRSLGAPQWVRLGSRARIGSRLPVSWQRWRLPLPAAIRRKRGSSPRATITVHARFTV